MLSFVFYLFIQLHSIIIFFEFMSFSVWRMSLFFFLLKMLTVSFENWKIEQQKLIEKMCGAFLFLFHFLLGKMFNFFNKRKHCAFEIVVCFTQNQVLALKSATLFVIGLTARIFRYRIKIFPFLLNPCYAYDLKNI